jgi:hypothetical protein
MSTMSGNYEAEGRDQECEKREERGTFYRRGGESTLGGAPAQGGASPPLHGGNPLINMR